MDIAKLEELVKAFNNLFSLTSLHVVSFEFHKILEDETWPEMLPIKIIPSKYYYLDYTLTHILRKKEKAFKNSEIEEALAYQKRENELLALKGINEQTKLRTMPEESFFEHDGHSIIAHLSKPRLIDRLLANLIEYYNLTYRKK